MNRKIIRKKQTEIVLLLKAGKLADALNTLSSMINDAGNAGFKSEFLIIETTYKNLLLYSIKGVIDPDKAKIRKQIIRQVLDLSDIVAQYAIMSFSKSGIYVLKNRLENTSRQLKDELYKSLTELDFESTLSSLLEEADLKVSDSYNDNHQKVLLNIFNLILLSDRMKQNDIDLLAAFFKADAFPWYEKSTVVTALTLSVIRCFDITKLDQLSKLVLNQNNEISARAITGIFMGLHYHKLRLDLYPEVNKIISNLKSFGNIEKEIEMVAIQFLRSLETENISRKLNEEIIPEVAKFHPKLQDSMDPESMISGDDMEENNPNWEKVFEDSPGLLNKLEEISKMQLEGADVMMNAFSRLKNFSFFNSLINWFVPFSVDHPEVTKGMESTDFDNDLFMNTISDSFYMCNSDKYSFVLQLQHMPIEQKKMMMNMLKAEVDSLKELKKEERLLQKDSGRHTIYMRYIQDLYRFFKIYPRKEDFADFFASDFDFYSGKLFSELVNDKNIYWNLAQYYFENKYYLQALDAFKHLNGAGVNNQEIFEKIGFCYQKLNQFENAIEYYKKSELFDSGSVWSLKKIGLCYRNIALFEKAISFYHDAEAIDPESVYIQTFLGHTYFDLEDYPNALLHYQKARNLQTDNKKLMRPVAWCLFITHKLEEAKYLLNELMQTQANEYDHMNMGHIEFCLSNIEKSMEHYQQSLKMRENNFSIFLKGFNSDIPFLKENGIKDEKINDLLEYLKFMSNN